MSSKRSIVVEHNGKTYHGEIGTIESTTLGCEDHGIWTAMLHVEWKGGGISVGGYCLDTPRKDSDGKHIGRFGTGFGLDHIMRICETIGGHRWESLVGRDVIVLFEGESHWGAKASGIAGVTNDKVLILAEHAEEWRALESVTR